MENIIKVPEKIPIGKAKVEVLVQNANADGTFEDLSNLTPDELRIKLGVDEVKDNLIVYQGYESLVQNTFPVIGLSGTSTFTTFAVSNGIVVPILTNSATTWDADGTQYRKLIQSGAWTDSDLTMTLTCFLNSAENAVSSITKFAIFSQTGTGGVMWNDILFTVAKSKNALIQLYFIYSLTFTQSPSINLRTLRFI